MRITLVARAAFQVAVLICSPLAALSTAEADPGPNCALSTPTEKADCGTITMVIGARTTSLDPVFGGPSTDYQPMYVQHGLLYRYDENLEPRRDLVDGETISADGLTITHKLRQGAKYSDGSSVLAEDVVFAYERWKAAGHSSAFIAPRSLISSASESSSRCSAGNTESSCRMAPSSR